MLHTLTPALYVVIARDVKALYPSLCKEIVTKALEIPLERHYNFNTKSR